MLIFLECDHFKFTKNNVKIYIYIYIIITKAMVFFQVLSFPAFKQTCFSILLLKLLGCYKIFCSLFNNDGKIFCIDKSCAL